MRVDCSDAVRGGGERCTRHRSTERSRTMSTTTTIMTTPPAAEVAVRHHPVRRAALTSGAVAAVGTTAVAAAADAAGVPLAIDGETIPLLGFAQLTVVGAVLGGL